jgi:hypothetical protein
MLHKNFCIGKIEPVWHNVIAAMSMPNFDDEEHGEPQGAETGSDARASDPQSIDALGMKIGNGNLDAAQEAKVRELLERNRDVFATKLADLTGTDAYYHKIEVLPGQTPARSRAYRHSPDDKREIERQVQEMLDAGIIEPCCSEYAAPMLLVRKKDGSRRVVID